MLIIPRIYLITGEDPGQHDDFLSKVQCCLEKGIRLIQFRAKQLTSDEYIELAKDILALTKTYHAKLIVNCDISTFEKVNADGVHFTSPLLMKTLNRPTPKDKLFSAACHTKEQLQHAQDIGADFVTLSPILHTKTHPSATPLGWDKFNALCAHSDLKIFALGGVNTQHLETSLKKGGYGIAAIRSLWTDDPTLSIPVVDAAKL